MLNFFLREILVENILQARLRSVYQIHIKNFVLVVANLRLGLLLFSHHVEKIHLFKIICRCLGLDCLFGFWLSMVLAYFSRRWKLKVADLTEVEVFEIVWGFHIRLVRYWCKIVGNLVKLTIIIAFYPFCWLNLVGKLRLSLERLILVL